MTTKELVVWICGIVGVVLIVAIIAGSVVYTNQTDAVVEDRSDSREKAVEKERPLKFWERERKGNQE